MKSLIGWGLTIGLYPGMLFGIRTYDNVVINGDEVDESLTVVEYVLYLPFIEIALILNYGHLT